MLDGIEDVQCIQNQLISDLNRYLIEYISTKYLTVITMRNNMERDILLKIKKGNYKYEEILNKANNIINGESSNENDMFNSEESLESLYKNSDLSEEIDIKYIQDVLKKVRKKFYGLD